jgi:tetratricopeptide (TPR) repeat protein
MSIDETAPDERASQPKLLEAGAQLGKYTLARLLGEGGMGQVWAAHDPDLDRDVALKLLRAENAAPQLRTRLLREARAMARLKHPNVLTVYEVGSVGDRDYIAMELVDGMNLDQWLATTPRPTDVWDALIAAGRGLAAAHRAGLVHRDFKPHNVLRSRDGRVLVTDFGLARGVGDELVQPLPTSLATPVALDVTLDAPAKDSVMDSPLTQTGALIGTPAYMAPEQYAGSPPDPRTDQFAFCVTVWQALGGQRPFDGQTLDELRRQTSRGVKNLKTKLPRGVRAVLVRGLDPDPNKRWDGVDELIAALEPHTEQRRKQRRWGWTSVALGAAATAVYFMRPHTEPKKPAPSPYACQAPEQAFADVWTSERRGALEKRVGNAAALAADALDGVRASWLKAYAAACAAPPSPTTFARLGCLLGERDEVAAFTRLADTLSTDAFDRLDTWGMLPRVEACASDSPVAPPLLPQDRKQRDKIVALRAEIAALRLRTPDDLLAKADDLSRAAKALGWEPLQPELDEALGTSAQLLGRYSEARKYLANAADRAAQLHDYRLEATARIALLETENEETDDPTDTHREEHLVQAARDAVRRAGNDPELSDSVDVIEASAHISRGDLATAEQLLAKDSWGADKGTKVAIMQTAQRMRLAMRRGDFQGARAIGEQHEATQPQAGRPHALIEAYMVQIAFRLGNLDQAHTRADKAYEHDENYNRVFINGVVKDAHGTPIGNARVVAWLGDLDGDARRIFTDRLTGDEVMTDADGRFSVWAAVDGAIMAERDDLRSTPIAVPAKGDDLTLVLQPVHGLSGKVTGPTPLPPLDAVVRFQAGKAGWLDHAVVGADRTYRVIGVPPGAAMLELTGILERDDRVITAGSARDNATLAWPSGCTLDVIVAKAGDVRVLRGGSRVHREGSTISIINGGNDTAQGPATPIGFANLTAEGQKQYARGNLHAVFHDIAPGPVVVCLDDKCIDATAPKTGTLALRIP